MTTTPETRPCLIFNPTAMDGPSDDLELVSAIFRAALQIAEIPDVRRAPLGQVVIALPHELYYRARTMVVAGSAQSLLDWMLQNHPGVGAVVARYQVQPENDQATMITEPLGDRHEKNYQEDERRLRGGEICGPRGELAIRAMAREVLIDKMKAEIAMLREHKAPDIECPCESCASWADIRGLLTSMLDPNEPRKSTIGMAKAAAARMRLLERQVADLSAELARRLAQDARVAEFDPGSIEAYQQGIVDRVLAIPGVLRVHWPQLGVLRAIVAISPDVPNHRESLEIQIEAAIDDPEIEHRVQEEPGEPAPGYRVRGGEAILAEAPTLRWYWRHESDDEGEEQGPLPSEADAVDETWDEHTADTAESMGDEP